MGRNTNKYKRKASSPAKSSPAKDDKQQKITTMRECEAAGACGRCLQLQHSSWPVRC